MNVPLPWYEQVNRAKTILGEFRSQYSDVPGVASTGLTKWDKKQIGKYNALTVFTEARQPARSDIPDSFEGLPVKKTQARADGSAV